MGRLHYASSVSSHLLATDVLHFHHNSLPVWFDVAVMAANCLFGAALARSRGVAVAGTLLVGLLIGLGGGAIRDMLLGQEPAVVTGWIYLPAGLAGAFIGAQVVGPVMKMDRRTMVLSAFTISFLMTIGAQKAVDGQVPWVSAIALGVITPTFGGLLADPVMGRRSVLIAENSWVLLSLVAGATVFVVATHLVNFWFAVVVGVLVTTAMRVMSEVFAWPSPQWPGRHPASGPGDEPA